MKIEAVRIVGSADVAGLIAAWKLINKGNKVHIYNVALSNNPEPVPKLYTTVGQWMGGKPIPYHAPGRMRDLQAILIEKLKAKGVEVGEMGWMIENMRISSEQEAPATLAASVSPPPDRSLLSTTPGLGLDFSGAKHILTGMSFSSRYFPKHILGIRDHLQAHIQVPAKQINALIASLTRAPKQAEEYTSEEALAYSLAMQNLGDLGWAEFSEPLIKVVATNKKQGMLCITGEVPKNLPTEKYSEWIKNVLYLKTGDPNFKFNPVSSAEIPAFYPFNINPIYIPVKECTLSDSNKVIIPVGEALVPFDYRYHIFYPHSSTTMISTTLKHVDVVLNALTVEKSGISIVDEEKIKHELAACLEKNLQDFISVHEQRRAAFKRSMEITKKLYDRALTVCASEDKRRLLMGKIEMAKCEQVEPILRKVSLDLVNDFTNRDIEGNLRQFHALALIRQSDGSLTTSEKHQHELKILLESLARLPADRIYERDLIAPYIMALVGAYSISSKEVFGKDKKNLLYRQAAKKLAHTALGLCDHVTDSEIHKTVFMGILFKIAKLENNFEEALKLTNISIALAEKENIIVGTLSRIKSQDKTLIEKIKLLASRLAKEVKSDEPNREQAKQYYEDAKKTLEKVSLSYKKNLENQIKGFTNNITISAVKLGILDPSYLPAEPEPKPEKAPSPVKKKRIRKIEAALEVEPAVELAPTPKVDRDTPKQLLAAQAIDLENIIKRHYQEHANLLTQFNTGISDSKHTMEQCKQYAAPNTDTFNRAYTLDIALTKGKQQIEAELNKLATCLSKAETKLTEVKTALEASEPNFDSISQDFLAIREVIKEHNTESLFTHHNVEIIINKIENLADKLTEAAFSEGVKFYKPRDNSDSEVVLARAKALEEEKPWFVLPEVEKLSLSEAVTTSTVSEPVEVSQINLPPPVIVRSSALVGETYKQFVKGRAERILYFPEEESEVETYYKTSRHSAMSADKIIYQLAKSLLMNAATPKEKVVDKQEATIIEDRARAYLLARMMAMLWEVDCKIKGETTPSRIKSWRKHLAHFTDVLSVDELKELVAELDKKYIGKTFIDLSEKDLKNLTELSIKDRENAINEILKNRTILPQEILDAFPSSPLIQVTFNKLSRAKEERKFHPLSLVTHVDKINQALNDFKYIGKDLDEGTSPERRDALKMLVAQMGGSLQALKDRQAEDGGALWEKLNEQLGEKLVAKLIIARNKVFHVVTNDINSAILLSLTNALMKLDIDKKQLSIPKTESPKISRR